MSTTSDTPSPLKRKIAAGAIVASLGIVAFVERDIKQRPSAQIRGPKFLWRIGSTNALVGLAYLRWGRKPAVGGAGGAGGAA